jgi:hypothetical protein
MRKVMRHIATSNAPVYLLASIKKQHESPMLDVSNVTRPSTLTFRARGRLPTSDFSSLASQNWITGSHQSGSPRPTLIKDLKSGIKKKIRRFYSDSQTSRRSANSPERSSRAWFGCIPGEIWLGGTAAAVISISASSSVHRLHLAQSGA